MRTPAAIVIERGGRGDRHDNACNIIVVGQFCDHIPAMLERRNTPAGFPPAQPTLRDDNDIIPAALMPNTVALGRGGAAAGSKRSPSLSQRIVYRCIAAHPTHVCVVLLYHCIYWVCLFSHKKRGKQAHAVTRTQTKTCIYTRHLELERSNTRIKIQYKQTHTREGRNEGIRAKPLHI